jgi:hypothetical protein
VIPTSSNAIRDALADHLITPQNLERVVQSGGKPIGWVSLGCELQRDWTREETVSGIIEIVLTERLLQE